MVVRVLYYFQRGSTETQYDVAQCFSRRLRKEYIYKSQIFKIAVIIQYLSLHISCI